MACDMLIKVMSTLMLWVCIQKEYRTLTYLKIFLLNKFDSFCVRDGGIA